MKIGIISDSHENLVYIKKAVSIFNSRKVSRVLHAGDIISPITYSEFSKLKCSMTAVFGNNDGEKFYLIKKFEGLAEFHSDLYTETIDGKKVIMFHKPNFLEEVVGSGKYDLIIYGHTHKIDIREGSPCVINPGEACGMITGKATIAIYDTEKNKPELISLND